MTASRPPSAVEPGNSSLGTSPFHAGEQAVQTRIGVRERVEQAGRRMLRDFMPAEHRQFFEDLPFILVGSADASGGLWASLLLGEPGFVKAPTSRTLRVHGRTLPADPLLLNLKHGAALGILGIELETRRRNRANGRVLRVDADGFELSVEQCFGNCQRYIQSRVGLFTPPQSWQAPLAERAALSQEACAILQRTDTSFIASASRSANQGGHEGLDVSHRGGRPGFIRGELKGDATYLTVPDFSGNFLFNTLGNIEVNPRAGFLALDFEGGRVLSLSGTARVIWQGPEVEVFEGAERLLEFRVQAGLLWRDVFRGWTEPEWSPHLRDTGTWGQSHG